MFAGEDLRGEKHVEKISDPEENIPGLLGHFPSSSHPSANPIPSVTHWNVS